MTPKDIDLVQASFAKVAPIAETAAGMFYGRLFEIAPEVRPLFESDLSDQGRKLMATLAVVVNGLRDLEAVVPAVEALARRHVAYGVRPEHYDPVGSALLWTLAEGLGDDFDPETESAWAGAYALLSGVMIAAAYDTPTAAE
jgi:nitric oxide dioxygenase